MKARYHVSIVAYGFVFGLLPDDMDAMHWAVRLAITFALVWVAQVIATWIYNAGMEDEA